MLKTFSGRKASQNEFELNSFIQFLRDHNVRRYLEIGARHGDTYHDVMMSLPVNSVGVAVDYPGALWGTHKSKQCLSDVNYFLKTRGYLSTVLIGDSTSPEVIKAIKALSPFDAILIDGDHRYEGVKQDWINFQDLAPIVAFHDIVGEGQSEKVSNNPVEVPRLWREIKDEIPELCVEFIDAGSKMGIGIVCGR
jgi:hypothetical protein